MSLRLCCGVGVRMSVQQKRGGPLTRNFTEYSVSQFEHQSDSKSSVPQDGERRQVGRAGARGNNWRDVGETLHSGFFAGC
jgi:hypothetical protein